MRHSLKDVFLRKLGQSLLLTGENDKNALEETNIQDDFTDEPPNIVQNNQNGV